MVSSVLEEKNLFDYGLRIDIDDIVLIGFSEAQLMSHRFVEGLVHEMCDIEDLGSVSMNLTIDVHISRIKIYQELCYEIVFVVQRQMLDNIPSTVRMMRTRASQLKNLIMGWDSLSPAERSKRLGGIRVKISVQTERVRDGRHLCSSLDLFRFGDVEAALRDGFLTRIIPIEEFMDRCHLEVSSFAAVLHGTNERVPSIRLQSALIFAR